MKGLDKPELFDVPFLHWRLLKSLIETRDSDTDVERRSHK